MDDKLEQVEKYHKAYKKHVRKQSLRDARRKAGPRAKDKKPRRKDWIPDAWDEWGEIDYQAEERVMPPGAAERRREVEKLASNIKRGGQSVETVESSGTGSRARSDSGISGLVVEVSSGVCRVDLGNHHTQPLLCDVRGSLKSHESGFTNVVAVGDWVRIHQESDQRGVVEEVLPRRNVLARPYAPDQGKLSTLQQIVVANVDRVLIVASWREPNIWPKLIDRYLITAQRNLLDAVICINKTDLITDQVEFQELYQAYSGLGVQILQTSTVSDQGIPELAELLGKGTTVLTGLSGVGKSSLLTAVQPDLDLRIGNVSQRGVFTGQGRHTTTQTNLWRLKSGGVVIDTPGVRNFGLVGVDRAHLAAWYPEMVEHLGACQYTDCQHIHEPGCAVKQALEIGSISAIRYKSYTQIFDELSS